MRTVMSILMVIFALSLPRGAFATQEEQGMLPLSEFRIQSEGIGESGAVSVEGVKDRFGKYVSLSVKAFGRVIELSRDFLAKIPTDQNGIQISYGHSPGSRTVYLVFLKGFTWSIKDKFIIAVGEDGSQRISKSP